MQDRSSQDDNNNDASSRITLKYISQIEMAINEIKPLAAKKSSFLVNDGLDAIRQAIESVDRTISQVKPQITSYENHRTPLLVGMDFYDQRQVAQANLDDALSTLKNIQPAYERKKQQLSNEIDQLHEERQRVRNEETTSKIIKIEESSNDIRKLREQQLALNNRRNVLDLKIQTKCCHCIPSAVKKEVKELNQIQNSLKDINDKISIRQQEIDNVKIDPVIDEVEVKRKKAISKRKKLINDFPKKLERAEKNVAHARKKLARLSAKRKKMEKQHLRDVSREVMFDLMHIFGRFSYLKDLIYQVYLKEKQKGHRALESVTQYRKKMESLDSANGLLAISKDKIERRMKHIRCEESDNSRGTELHQQLEKLPAKDKQHFMQSEYSPNELMDMILPLKNSNKKVEVTVDDIANANVSSMSIFSRAGDQALPTTIKEAEKTHKK